MLDGEEVVPVVDREVARVRPHAEQSARVTGNHRVPDPRVFHARIRVTRTQPGKRMCVYYILMKLFIRYDRLLNVTVGRLRNKFKRDFLVISQK